MYIVPNSEIYILKDVPIEPNYNHTLYFSDRETQLAYFTDYNKVIVHLRDYTRIRVTENEITVEYPVDELYNANYMMFRNNSFGPKPFYAFITNVEYVNNKTTRISYVLDVMQTWFFEHTLGQCFVVREHSATDVPGDNLLPEDLELGEYIYKEYSVPAEIDMFSEWAIFIGSTVDANGADIVGGMYQGMYSGVRWLPFETAGDANTYLSGLTETLKSSAIIGIVMLPKRCAELAVTTQIAGVEVPIPISYYPNGYVPRNKKLCTAPYTQLMVTDFMGHAASYKYEYFEYTPDNGTVNFLVEAPISSVPQFTNTPMYYKGLSEGPTQRVNYLESLIISDVPQCAFTIDSYRAWIAMKSTQVGIGTELIGGAATIAGGILDTAVSRMSGSHTRPRNQTDYEGLFSGINEIASGASQIANTLARWYDASLQPPQAKSIGGGSAIFQLGEYGYHYIYTYIRPEYAQIIDDYFTMYGYKSNRVKYPNVKNFPAAMRPYWNYIKVINCKLEGSLPVEYEQALHEIYERGITFWSAPYDVGNYSLDNSPRGGN